MRTREELEARLTRLSIKIQKTRKALEALDRCTICGRTEEQHTDYTCEGQFCNYCFLGEEHDARDCDA